MSTAMSLIASSVFFQFLLLTSLITASKSGLAPNGESSSRDSRDVLDAKIHKAQIERAARRYHHTSDTTGLVPSTVHKQKRTPTLEEKAYALLHACNEMESACLGRTVKITTDVNGDKQIRGRQQQGHAVQRSGKKWSDIVRAPSEEVKPDIVRASSEEVKPDVVPTSSKKKWSDVVRT